MVFEGVEGIWRRGWAARGEQGSEEAGQGRDGTAGGREQNRTGRKVESSARDLVFSCGQIVLPCRPAVIGQGWRIVHLRLCASTTSGE